MDYKEVHTAVKSAMSGNGKLPVNWSIRRLKQQLRTEFGHTQRDFYDLTNDYTITMLGNHVVWDKYDPKRGSFQPYANGVIKNYLLNTIKLLRMKRVPG